MSDQAGRRLAGLLIPLFSSPSTTSWGVGDIGDIEPLARWLARGRQRLLQLLPMNEMAPGQASPYSAISAMAIDPIFVDLRAVPEFASVGGESSLDAGARARLNEVRGASDVEYTIVRDLKERALRAAFDTFLRDEWGCSTPRAAALKAFIGAESWWLDDYSIFRAIHAREDERAWPEWPDALRRREPSAIDDARRELAREILFRQYVQWIASAQWHDARARANAHGVRLFGDLPFMVDGDSADVWARQDEFLLDASLGVPPDAFSATGQDWGMPVYRWEAHAANGYEWLRQRARRGADLYDGYRIDHLVGFYRTYGRPRDGGEPFFTPADESDQLALGERLLGLFSEIDAEIVAEDLGTVPDFVRASLARLGLPGFRVFRWEREWKMPGQPYRDPTDYPPISVATSGTHDTEPMAVWWDELPYADRALVAELPTVSRAAHGVDIGVSDFTPMVRDVLLESLFAAGSNLLILPIQDVFGWRQRINEPATVGGGNWTFRLPWPIDRVDEIPEARERSETLKSWSDRYNR